MRSRRICDCSLTYGEAQLRLAHKIHARVHGSEAGRPRFFGLGARKLRRRSADRWRGGAGGRLTRAAQLLTRRRLRADDRSPPPRPCGSRRRRRLMHDPTHRNFKGWPANLCVVDTPPRDRVVVDTRRDDRVRAYFAHDST